MKIKGKKLLALGRSYPLIEDRDMETDGLTCPVDETITINPNCNNVTRAILHEAGHAAIFSGGIFEAIDNEKICEIICEQFARVMDENFEIRWRKK